jgi:nucleoside-diphosphate-sugar epimerase
MTAEDFPDAIHDEEQLEDLLSTPSDAAVRTLGHVEGDLLLLGVAGKMGPTLARMARRASDRAGVKRRVIGVSRFSKPGSETALQGHGVETIRGDLLDESFLSSLPEAPHVIYMTGMKFGASGSPAQTWAMNVHLPALVCRRFRHSRIVAFSTGNVYPLVPIDSGGSHETDPTGPVGEYAMTALGRERMFEYFSQSLGIPTTLVRLNYAVEMRYGVLVDIARQVWAGEVIDLSMGYANVIWQGDANAMALAALADTTCPPLIVNVAGPERVSVRATAEAFGRLLGKTPRFSGSEAPTALLSNGTKARQRYGRPRVTCAQMIHWIAHWIRSGGPTLDKPTHFEVRNGTF